MEEKIRGEKAFSYLEVMVGVCVFACAILTIGSICEEGVRVVYAAQNVYEASYNARNVIVSVKEFFNNPINYKHYQLKPHHNLSEIIQAKEREMFYSLSKYSYTIGFIPLEKRLKDITLTTIGDNSYFLTTDGNQNLATSHAKVLGSIPYHLNLSIKKQQKEALMGISEAEIEDIEYVTYVMILIVEDIKTNKVVKRMIQLYSPQR